VKLMTSKQDKALLYVRVSDLKQKIEGHGLESQEHRCRQFAAENGYVVEKVFSDDVTGGGDFAKRPAMNLLLDYLKQNKKNDYVVIFDDIKRFSRDVYFYWGLIHRLEEYNATPKSPNFVFEKTPEGRFQQSITVAAGEYERESIARQTRQKTKARLEAGYYAFIAPVGFKYTKSKAEGKIIVKDEPVASVITEAMEGFASGRFQTKEEAKRFLENSPEFPKSASGKISNGLIDRVLSNPLYAGYIEYKPWGVDLRKGRHEGMVSFEMFHKIQDRLAGRTYAPARKDLNIDFPLRNAVACECGNALTSCWSKSCTGRRYAYYLCQNRKCEHKGKSIRREVLEGEFEELLKKLTPSSDLISTADKMFKKLWDHHARSQAERKKQLEQERRNLDKKSDQLLDRIVEAENPMVVKAFEKRIEAVQKEKLVIEEKILSCGQPLRPYNEMYRTALEFLANPLKIWSLGGFIEKRMVLKLAFVDCITYDRKTGYRTPDLSLPFKALGGFFMEKNVMVPRDRIELPTRGFSVATH